MTTVLSLAAVPLPTVSFTVAAADPRSADSSSELSTVRSMAQSMEPGLSFGATPPFTTSGPWFLSGDLQGTQFHPACTVCWELAAGRGAASLETDESAAPAESKAAGLVTAIMADPAKCMADPAKWHRLTQGASDPRSCVQSIPVPWVTAVPATVLAVRPDVPEEKGCGSSWSGMAAAAPEPATLAAPSLQTVSGGPLSLAKPLHMTEAPLSSDTGIRSDLNAPMARAETTKLLTLGTAAKDWVSDCTGEKDRDTCPVSDDQLCTEEPALKPEPVSLLDTWLLYPETLEERAQDAQRSSSASWLTLSNPWTSGGETKDEVARGPEPAGRIVSEATDAEDVLPESVLALLTAPWSFDPSADPGSVVADALGGAVGHAVGGATGGVLGATVEDASAASAKRARQETPGVVTSLVLDDTVKAPTSDCFVTALTPAHPLVQSSSASRPAEQPPRPRGRDGEKPDAARASSPSLAQVSRPCIVAERRVPSKSGTWHQTQQTRPTGSKRQRRQSLLVPSEGRVQSMWPGFWNQAIRTPALPGLAPGTPWPPVWSGIRRSIEHGVQHGVEHGIQHGVEHGAQRGVKYSIQPDVRLDPYLPYALVPMRTEPRSAMASPLPPLDPGPPRAIHRTPYPYGRWCFERTTPETRNIGWRIPLQSLMAQIMVFGSQNLQAFAALPHTDDSWSVGLAPRRHIPLYPEEQVPCETASWPTAVEVVHPTTLHSLRSEVDTVSRGAAVAVCSCTGHCVTSAAPGTSMDTLDPDYTAEREVIHYLRNRTSPEVAQLIPQFHLGRACTAHLPPTCRARYVCAGWVERAICLLRQLIFVLGAPAALADFAVDSAHSPGPRSPLRTPLPRCRMSVRRSARHDIPLPGGWWLPADTARRRLAALVHWDRPRHPGLGRLLQAAEAAVSVVPGPAQLAAGPGVASSSASSSSSLVSTVSMPGRSLWVHRVGCPQGVCPAEALVSMDRAYIAPSAFSVHEDRQTLRTAVRSGCLVTLVLYTTTTPPLAPLGTQPIGPQGKLEQQLTLSARFVTWNQYMDRADRVASAGDAIVHGSRKRKRQERLQRPDDRPLADASTLNMGGWSSSMGTFGPHGNQRAEALVEVLLPWAPSGHSQGNASSHYCRWFPASHRGRRLARRDNVAPPTAVAHRPLYPFLRVREYPSRLPEDAVQLEWPDLPFSVCAQLRFPGGASAALRERFVSWEELRSLWHAAQRQRSTGPDVPRQASCRCREVGTHRKRTNLGCHVPPAGAEPLGIAASHFPVPPLPRARDVSPCACGPRPQGLGSLSLDCLEYLYSFVAMPLWPSVCPL